MQKTRVYRGCIRGIAACAQEFCSRGVAADCLANVRPEAIYGRNPRRTDWDSFREDLFTGLCGFPKRHGTGVKMELCVDHLQRALMGSFEKNCSAKAVRSNKKVFWWRPGLERESWRRFCESMEKVPEASRLCRNLARNPDSNLQINSAGFRGEPDVDPDAWTMESRLRARGCDWELAVKTFKPFKSAGSDKIFPAVLQEGLVQISGPFTRTLRACLALGYPKAGEGGIHTQSR
ncbi:hypothetical protein ACFW04_011476 [Cataglyphis niger]